MITTAQSISVTINDTTYERDRIAPCQFEPVRRGDQEGAAGQHLPLHWLLEHLRSRQGGRAMTTTTPTVAPEVTEAPSWSGQSVPRKEDRRLLQGQGVFID